MWCGLLFVSEKKYDMSWVEEYAAHFSEYCSGSYQFSEDIEKKAAAFDSIFDRHSVFFDIPETFYKSLDDEEIIKDYKNNLNNLNNRPTIEEYYNTQDGYVVRDGNLYITKNYVDGVYDFVNVIKEWAWLTDKDGRKNICLQMSEVDMTDELLSEYGVIMFDDEALTYYDFRWDRSDEVLSKQRAVLKNVKANMYLYGLGIHF